MTIQRIAIDPVRDRATWLALRQQDITASDVPAVCGEGMFGSATKVWAEKRDMIGPQATTAAMQRGLWGEAAVFEAIADKHPDWEVRRAKTYFRDVEAKLGATPDGAALIPGFDGVTVLQAKVVSRTSFESYWLEDASNINGPFRVPLAYQLQTLTEAMLADAPRAMVVALVIGREWDEWLYREAPVERNAAAEAKIRKMVAEFRAKYLDTGIQPPVDPERDADIMKALYPKGKEAIEIDLSGDNEIPEIVFNLEEARAAKKKAAEIEDAAKTAIADKMRDAGIARLADGRRISFKSSPRAGYVVADGEVRTLRILKK